MGTQIDLHCRGAFFDFVLKVLSEGIIFRWKCGTCTWSRSRSRRSPCTSTCAPSCAASMRTTASSTSSSAAGMGPTLRSWPAATTISSGGCWTWRSSFHLGSPPKISVWMPFNSDKSALMFFSAGCLIEAPARKWRWRLLERLPSQRRCSNPERLGVLLKIAVTPQSDIYLIFSQMRRCAPVERGKRTKSPSTASTSTRRFFTQPGILRWDLRLTIYHCYWFFSKSFAIDLFSSPNVLLLMVS